MDSTLDFYFCKRNKIKIDIVVYHVTVYCLVSYAASRSLSNFSLLVPWECEVSELVRQF